MKRRNTKYSILTAYTDRKATRSFGFYYNINKGHKIPKDLDARKLSHAKIVLQHCRKVYPKWEHKIFKTITIVETLDY